MIRSAQQENRWKVVIITFIDSPTESLESVPFYTNRGLQNISNLISLEDAI